MYLLPHLCTTNSISREVTKFEKFTMVVERKASGDKDGFEQCTSEPYVLSVQSLLG